MNTSTIIARLTEELISAEQRLAAATSKEQAGGYDALTSMDRTEAQGYLTGIQHALDILENA